MCLCPLHQGCRQPGSTSRQVACAGGLGAGPWAAWARTGAGCGGSLGWSSQNKMQGDTLFPSLSFSNRLPSHLKRGNRLDLRGSCVQKPGSRYPWEIFKEPFKNNQDLKFFPFLPFSIKQFFSLVYKWHEKRVASESHLLYFLMLNYRQTCWAPKKYKEGLLVCAKHFMSLDSRWLLHWLSCKAVIICLFRKVAAVPSVVYFILGEERWRLLKILRTTIKDCFKRCSISDGLFIIKLEPRVSSFATEIIDQKVVYKRDLWIENAMWFFAIMCTLDENSV